MYALYQKSRRVRLFLSCCWLVEVAVMAIFIGITFANIKGMCRCIRSHETISCSA